MIHLELPPITVLQREYELHVTERHKWRTVKHERNVSRLLARSLPPQPLPADLLAYLNRRVHAGEIATSTANAYLQTAFKLYDLASVNYGVPNAFRAIKPFPPSAPRPRVVKPLPGLEAGGRRSRVEWWMAGAARDDVERGLLFFLFDSGCRIQEALAVRLGAVKPDGSLRIEAQRNPHADVGELEAPKTRASAAVIQLSQEGTEWIARATRAPERSRWGGNWRGREKRSRLAAEYVFPFTQRQLDGLLARLRRIDPESFPRRVTGVRGGDAWHPFRHAFATDVYEAAEAGVGAERALEVVQRALRHAHSEWTRTYVEPLRGRDNRIDRSAVDAMRRAQAAAGRSAAGVTELGRRDARGDADGVGAALVRGAPGAAHSGRGASLAGMPDGVRAAAGAHAAGPARGAIVTGVAGGNIAHLSAASQHRASGAGCTRVEDSSGCRESGASTQHTPRVDTQHVAPRLPLPPYPLTQRPSRRGKGGR